jgi:hypothetical protein
MPVLTLTWQTSHYTPQNGNYLNAPWIQVVAWRRNDNNTLLPNKLGLYIILDATNGPPGVPVYVGQAVAFRDRFNGRSDALRDLGLNAATVNHLVVKIATLNPQNQLNTAERWLIRYLFLRDAAVNLPRRMQNVEKTGPFYAPGGGLTVNNNGLRPNYLQLQYNYLAGAAIGYP